MIAIFVPQSSTCHRLRGFLRPCKSYLGQKSGGLDPDLSIVISSSSSCGSQAPDPSNKRWGGGVLKRPLSPKTPRIPWIGESSGLQDKRTKGEIIPRTRAGCSGEMGDPVCCADHLLQETGGPEPSCGPGGASVCSLWPSHRAQRLHTAGAAGPFWALWEARDGLEGITRHFPPRAWASAFTGLAVSPCVSQWKEIESRCLPSHGFHVLMGESIHIH